MVDYKPSELTIFVSNKCQSGQSLPVVYQTTHYKFAVPFTNGAVAAFLASPASPSHVTQITDRHVESEQNPREELLVSPTPQPVSWAHVHRGCLKINFSNKESSCLCAFQY